MGSLSSYEHHPRCLFHRHCSYSDPKAPSQFPWQKLPRALVLPWQHCTGCWVNSISCYASSPSCYRAMFMSPHISMIVPTAMKLQTLQCESSQGQRHLFYFRVSRVCLGLRTRKTDGQTFETVFGIFFGFFICQVSPPTSLFRTILPTVRFVTFD